MADYIGIVTCRHPFKVRDADRFEKTFNKLNTELEYRRNPDNTFVIYGCDNMNIWEDRGERSIWLPEFVQQHIDERQVAVFREVGWTKARYLGGGGVVAIVTQDRIISHDLNDLVERELRGFDRHWQIPET
jgi:hypothetical protein